ELDGARAHDDGALDDGEAEFVDGLDAGAVFSRDDVVVDVRDPLLRHARLEAVERVEGVVADGDLAGDGLEVDRDAGLAFEDAAEVGAEGLAAGADDAAGGRVDGDALLEVEHVVRLGLAVAVEAVEAEGFEEALAVADGEAGERGLGGLPVRLVEHVELEGVRGEGAAADAVDVAEGEAPGG